MAPDNNHLPEAAGGCNEREYAAKLAALRAAIDDGDASGVADGNPFDLVRAAIQALRKTR